MTAPLTAEAVAQIIGALYSRAADRGSCAKTAYTIRDMDSMIKAADTITVLATQLAERDAELARVTAQRDTLARAIDEYEPNPALMARIIITNIERGCDLTEATSRIAALTEAGDILAADASQFHSALWSDAKAALTTDKEPTEYERKVAQL